MLKDKDFLSKFVKVSFPTLKGISGIFFDQVRKIILDFGIGNRLSGFDRKSNRKRKVKNDKQIRRLARL